MEKIVCTASNACDYITIRNKMKEIGVDVEYSEYFDIDININNIEVVSNEKARILFQKTNSPVIVIETGYLFGEDSKNLTYPIIRFNVNNKKNNILETVNENEKSTMMYLITFYNGINFTRFYSLGDGKIVKNINCDNNNCIKDLFVPTHSELSTCSMLDEELEASEIYEANNEFITWVGRQKKLSYKIEQ